jgi:hypothetical protein
MLSLNKKFETTPGLDVQKGVDILENRMIVDYKGGRGG